MGRKGWHPGRAVRMAREDDGLDQAALCRKLETESGESWYQAKLSRIELGKQKMSTDELLLFAKVQDRTWAWYLVGPQAAASSNVDGATGRQLQPARRFRINPGKSGFTLRPAVA